MEDMEDMEWIKGLIEEIEEEERKWWESDAGKGYYNEMVKKYGKKGRARKQGATSKTL